MSQLKMLFCVSLLLTACLLNAAAKPPVDLVSCENLLDQVLIDAGSFKIPVPKLPPALRGGPPKLNQSAQTPLDDGDIPRAVPPDKKPVRP